MRKYKRVLWFLMACGTALLLASKARAQSVLTYHGSPSRAGNYIMPNLTWERA
jgi:hypothetical protein